MYCRTCGREVPDKAEICIYCGVKPLGGESYCWCCGATTQHAQEVCLKCGVLLKKKLEAGEAVSDVWWLLPVFLGWIGGLIAWLVNKDKNPRKSRNILITGIVISGGLVLLYFIYIIIMLVVLTGRFSNF